MGVLHSQVAPKGHERTHWEEGKETMCSSFGSSLKYSVEVVLSTPQEVARFESTSFFPKRT